MSRVVAHKRAVKYLENLPNPLQKRIKTTLAQLAESPQTYPNAIRMAGNWSGYQRIRVGQIRIIF